MSLLNERSLLKAEVETLVQKLNDAGSDINLSDILEGETSLETLDLAALRLLKKDLRDMLRTLGGARGI